MTRVERLGIALAVLLAAGAAFVVGRRSLVGGSPAPDGGDRDLVLGSLDVTGSAERPGLASPDLEPAPLTTVPPVLPPAPPFVPTPSAPGAVPDVQDAEQARALGRHVSGVVRRLDGEPLPARGTLLLRANGIPSSSTDVIDGAFDLWIASDGPFSASLTFADAVVTVPRVRLAADGTLRVVLPPPSRPVVRVLDAHGAAVPGATVVCVDALDGRDDVVPLPAVKDPAALAAPDLVRVTTGPDGTATLPSTWSGWSVVVEAPGLARRALNARDDVEVTLAAGGDVEATVVDAEGRAFTVEFTAAPPAFDVACVATDAAGRARSPRFAAGPVDVRLLPRDGGAPLAITTVDAVPGRTVPVTLVPPARPAGPRADAVDVEGSVRIPAAWRAAFPDATWTLRLTPRSGAPVREARSVLLARPGADPVPFDLRAVAAGAYTVRLEPVGWSADVEIAHGASVLALTVPEPVVVRVQALDEETGAAVALAPDAGSRAAFRASLPPPLGPSAPASRELFLPGERRTFVVRAVGHAPAVVDVGPFDAGAPPTTVPVRLARPATLKVITRVDGRVVELRGLALQWGPTEDALPFSVRSRDLARGTFTDVPLGPGFVSVVVEGLVARDGALDDGGDAVSYEGTPPRRVELRAGEDATLEVEFVAHR